MPMNNDSSNILVITVVIMVVVIINGNNIHDFGFRVTVGFNSSNSSITLALTCADQSVTPQA